MTQTFGLQNEKKECPFPGRVPWAGMTQAFGLQTMVPPSPPTNGPPTPAECGRGRLHSGEGFMGSAPVSGPGQNVRLSNFQWSQVIYNREHKAIIGFILVAAFLWVKMIWL